MGAVYLRHQGAGYQGNYQGKYSQRLRTFLEFSGFDQPNVPLEDKARCFAVKAQADNAYAFNSLLRFFQMQRERIDRKEVAIGTVINYAKAIKPFYEMATPAFAKAREQFGTGIVHANLGICAGLRPAMHSSY